MRWTVETLNQTVDRELEQLPPKLRGRMLRLMEMVENVGLENLHDSHVNHVEGKLWELRAKAEGGKARGLYITAKGPRVIILHVFAKKSQKTPRAALQVARQRMKMVIEND